MRLAAKAIGVVALGVAMISIHARAQGGPDVPPDKCPAIGTAKSAAEQALNTKKNRDTEPSDNQIDAGVTLDGMLRPGDDTNRFDEKKGAVIEGYVVNVQQGGHPETANCGSMSLAFTDTHITVGQKPDAPESETLIVEVTPRWRVKMGVKNVDWGTEHLQSVLLHHKVRFRGWLMFDTSHAHESGNTADAGTPLCPPPPARSRTLCIWRKTAWEVHPVTEIDVIP